MVVLSEQKQFLRRLQPQAVPPKGSGWQHFACVGGPRVTQAGMRFRTACSILFCLVCQKNSQATSRTNLNYKPFPIIRAFSLGGSCSASPAAMSARSCAEMASAIPASAAQGPAAASSPSNILVELYFEEPCGKLTCDCRRTL